MWRSLWRSADRFSLQYFKYIIHELQEIEVVDPNNRELVVDILQSIVEIVTYGDRHDPLIFECFMEHQVLAEFVRVLKISRNSRIEAPLLQYLSIMIQNMDSEHATYYCFSNDYINSIIAHKFDFDGGDLAPYYISFLRAVSGKMNKDTLCLLAKVERDVVTSFPLYSEALKFSHYAEKMIQIAVRALTLNVYNVSDDLVYQFVTTAPASKYFSDLIERLKKQCIHLDAIVHSTKETCTQERRKILQIETDKFVDDLYYFKDILCVGECRLGKLVTQNLLCLLVLPILLPLLELRKSNGLNISAITSLYIVSRTLQVIGGKNILESVAGVILYTCVTSISSTTDADIVDGISPTNSFLDHLDEMVCLDPEFQGEENIDNNYLLGHLAEYMSSDSHFMRCLKDNACTKRGGILGYIFSDNHSLLLASLYLLLVLAESKDLDKSLTSLTRLNQMQEKLNYDISDSQPADGSIFWRLMPQILNALLKVLASQPPSSVLVQWHTGWVLRKLLVFQERLSDHNLQLFNNSYEQSCERLQKELDGCWFDFIPDTLRNEWASCKTVLEESIQDKDPCFTLELADCEPTMEGSTTYLAWRRMIDAVKVFILQLQLKAFILKVDLPAKPLLNFSSSPADSGRTHVSDILSSSFGSEVPLGSGVPCKIAFANAGIRDIYLVPVASGISGKLLLAEKHPFRSQKGIVFAIAPLAGLRPKINGEHPTWLHLQLREFSPKFDVAKTRDQQMSNQSADGRFTLGFPNAEACEAALSLILKETSKQRSSVESIIAPLLQQTYLEESQ